MLSLLLLTGLLHAGEAAGGVSVFDQVATPAKPFFLKLRTHRGLMPMGGVRGEFWIGEQRVGRCLTGADGYGFLKFTVSTAGVYKISARTTEGDADGRLLVVDKSAKTVLFEVEPLLWRTLIGQRGNDGHRVMKQIAADYQLIYLCGLMGKTVARKLIRDRDLPDSIVLVGKNHDQFAQLQHREINLYAVVGSSTFVTAAEAFCPRRFSFENSAAATRVQDWNDLLLQINKRSEKP
ncbi:MAG: hypothetical protein JJV98_06610 [Desulfosarcina sp.]|nr:hypothetical protein [Desulfobacterales bacterium]